MPFVDPDLDTLGYELTEQENLIFDAYIEGNNFNISSNKFDTFGIKILLR